MQRDKFFRIFWRLVQIVCVCRFALFWIGVIKSPFSEGEPEQGKPYCSEKVELIWSEISDYLVYGDHLAVLYDPKDVVQLYSLDGDPQYTYQFSFLKNGRAKLYTDGVNLIVEDKLKRNYYLFSEQGAFLNYIKDEQKKTALSDTFLSKTEARTAKDGCVYERRGASIYKTSAAGETKNVVSRPFFMVVFQGAATLICALICGFMLVVRQERQKSLKKRRTVQKNNSDPRRENGVL